MYALGDIIASNLLDDTKQTQTQLPAVSANSNTAIANNHTLMPEICEKSWNFCKAMSKSKLLPMQLQATADHDTTADIYMICGLGHSLGLDFFQAINGIYCLPGALPALYVRAKRALVLRAGGVFKTETVDLKQGIATCVISRAGVDYTGTFTVADAIRRGKLYKDERGQIKACLTKSGKASPWADWPVMLLNRAVGRACDKGFADVLLGLSSAEDIQDVFQNVVVDQNANVSAPAKEEAPAVKAEVIPASNLMSAIKSSERTQKAVLPDF